MHEPTEIHDYVIKVLNVADAGYRQVDENLLAAQVSVEHPPLFFGPPRLENILLNLVFRPEDVGRYPGAELVVPGSYRLDWFIDGMRRRGRLALQYVHCEMNLRHWQRDIQAKLPKDFPYFFFHHPSLTYRPFLLANIAIAYRTDERRDEIFSIALDLTSGEIWPDLLETLKSHHLSNRLPTSGLEKEGIKPIEAVEICKKQVEEYIGQQDRSWADEAKQRFEEESNCLREYYIGEEKNEDYKRRADEIYDKFRPRIILSWVNLALLYLPRISYTLQSLSGSPLPKAVYYPVGERLVLEEEQAAQENPLQ
ncbi:MAG TPA: YqhG family protein [Bacillota bacterium]|nr:YqhG family protein [Bacillota bacterium]